jgi:excisionase family DNA binding protein
MEKEEKSKQLTFDQLPVAVGQIMEELQDIKTILQDGTPRKIVGADYISIEDVAKELNYSVSYVRRLIKDGTFNSKVFGRRIMIHRIEVEKFIVAQNAKKDVMRARDMTKARKANAEKRLQMKKS